MSVHKGDKQANVFHKVSIAQEKRGEIRNRNLTLESGKFKIWKSSWRKPDSNSTIFGR
jgi:hypothetical protein